MTVEVEEEKGTALAVRQTSSAWALARLSDKEFEASMEAAKKGRSRLQQVMRAMMKENVHYGKIPGVDRLTLLKPGAEVLCQMFQLVPDVHADITYGDGVTAPHITVKSRCTLHLGSIEGETVGVGEASANSWEKKWRYRQAERRCPSCGKNAIIKGKAEYGGGWLCWKKKDGCGAQFADDAQAIVGQQAGQVENPDPYELLNTMTKICNKRAKMDAVITATASSDLLTQDMEEGEREEKAEAAKKTADANPVKKAALHLLTLAANKGLAAYEKQWKALTVDERVLCKDEHPALKQRAAMADRPGTLEDENYRREPGEEG